MRKLIFFLGGTIMYCMAGAQVSIHGGVNKTGLIKAANDYEDASGSYAWGAGVDIGLPIGKTLSVQSGLIYEKLKLKRNAKQCCILFALDMAIDNLVLPVVLEKKIFLGKKTSLKISGGAFVAIAAGGRKKGIDISSMFSSFYPLLVTDERDISFGNEAANDLRRWTWGLQAGSGVGWERWGINFHYRYGLNKLASQDTYPLNILRNSHYSNCSLDLSYQVINRGKHKK